MELIEMREATEKDYKAARAAAEKIFGRTIVVAVNTSGL